MRIKRLKISGFKSFVDPAELRIEAGLTGIVGPNGCGKSNLLEALRWTMGEASAKSLRGGAMDDVIFAGTATRPSRDFAEVTILGESDAANDDHELEVVRRIERGAGSAYRINGRDVRARDVALLFADAATGAHSPALVSQGRIGAIIAAKPGDRRAMLEEAAGISGLHVRRRDAENKLRATETNLERLDELLGDIETRIATLRRQARAAEKYRKLSEDIRIAEARLIYARWREAAAAADKAKAEAAQAEALVQSAGDAQRGAAQTQAQAVSAFAMYRTQAQAARDAMNAAVHQLAALDAERTTLDQRIRALGEQTERLTRDRAREGQLAHDAAQALTRLSEEAKRLAAAVGAAESERPANAARLAAAEAALHTAELALAQARSEEARERAETRVADAALAAARARLARCVTEQQRLANEIAAFGEAAPLIAARDAAVRARQTATNAAAAAATEIVQAEAARHAAAEARQAAEQAAAAAHAEHAALEAEARTLIKAVESTRDRARVLDQISAQPGYERALASALGDDLDAGLGSEGRRGWAGAEALPGDPPLPAGVMALAQFVSAPPALARRLAQIGVVDHDDGIALAVGQRLVTRAGTLRRWDGYVATGQGAAAAERLERVNRLAALDLALPAARSAAQAAREAATTAQAAAEAARRSGEAARTARDAADAQARQAARDEDQASAALDRLAARRAEASERATRLADDTREAEHELSTAQAARAALPDGSATAARVAQLQAASEAGYAEVARARADAATLDRTIASDRERHAATQSEARGWKARSGEAAARITEIETRAHAAAREAEALSGAPAALAARRAEQEARSGSLSDAAANAAADEQRAEAELRAIDARLAELGEALAAARELRAGALARVENQELRRVEMGRIAGERFECPPPLLPERAGFAPDSIGETSRESQRHETLNAERERLGPVNLVAESELAELEAGRATSLAERSELAEAVSRLRGSITSLNREGRSRLLAAFEAVNQHFERLFATLFDGGQAHLALIDSDDPLEAGLEIFAQPPGKKLQSLTLLSGGEQALTAVALIFGLFLTNPAPICVLDEVDAPLDDANIERFCDLLDRMARETQTRYLIVTHNAVTMSRMHRLFGVTMIEQGISRLVSVDLGGAVDLLAAE